MRRGLSALLTMDTIFLVVLAAVGLIYLVQAYGLNPLAGNLPKIIAWMMLILIAFLMYGKVRDAFKPLDKTASTEGQASAAAPEAVIGRKVPWFVSVVLLALYPLSLIVVGFPAGTFIFLTGLSALLGLKPLHALIFGTLGTAALYFLFVAQFQVPLPEGIILESIRGY